MNQLTRLSSHQTMSSREIASLTGKQHKHVLDDARKMLESLGIQSADFSADYQDAKGRTYQELLLNKDLTITLITGYSAPLRYKVVQRWQELESQTQFSLPKTFSEALSLAAEQAKQLEAQAPKVQFYDTVAERETLKNSTQVAQMIGMKSAVALNKELDSLNVFNKNIKRSRAFQSWFVENGLGKMVDTETGHAQALFTVKGEQWIFDKLKSEGVI